MLDSNVEKVDNLNIHDAKVTHVEDGDTFNCKVKVGFGLETEIVVRLPKVDTHETKTKKGKREKEFAKRWINKAKEESCKEYKFEVVTKEDYPKGGYGRYLCKLRRKTDNQYISEALFNKFNDIKYGDDS
ncbi:MAG: hypothetical protein ABEI78_01200 [Candidatus Nanohaloarchaea archaeon]